MSEIGRYMYGIIKSDGDEISHHTKGLGAGVYTVPYQDIAAVVSDSEIVDYAHLPKDEAARRLVRHQQVIEKVMEHFFPVIPTRLGTYGVDNDEVRHILAKGYPIIKDIFPKITDKVEIDVVATWSDINLILKKLGEEKEIKEFKQKLLANPEAITIDDQIKIGSMVKDNLDQRREKYALQIHDALGTVSQDFKEHEVMDDTMVSNTAFFIDKANSKNFDNRVEELNANFAEKLNFRCIGPLPPYSFYTLEVKKLQFEEIEWARKKLGLNGLTANRGEIKKAYQRTAFYSHPDKKPDKSGMGKEFNEITRAYKFLLEYCQDDHCSFGQEDFTKYSLIVQIRE
jgi:hypothetical protein